MVGGPKEFGGTKAFKPLVQRDVIVSFGPPEIIVLSLKFHHSRSSAHYHFDIIIIQYFRLLKWWESNAAMRLCSYIGTVLQRRPWAFKLFAYVYHCHETLYKALNDEEIVYFGTILMIKTCLKQNWWLKRDLRIFCRWSNLSRFTRFWGDQSGHKFAVGGTPTDFKGRDCNHHRFSLTLRLRFSPLQHPP